MVDLSPAERQRLKAHAHKLHPVVMIGDKGLTDAVLRAIDASLKSHELVKIKVASDDRTARAELLASICSTLDASAVQHIGRILVLYRENPVLVAAPAPAPAPTRTKPVRSKRAGTRRAGTKPAGTRRAGTKPARVKPVRSTGSAPRTRPNAKRARPTK